MRTLNQQGYCFMGPLSLGDVVDEFFTVPD